MTTSLIFFLFHPLNIYILTCNTETFISNYFPDRTETSEEISISEIYSIFSGQGDDSVVDAENMPETGIEEEQIINLSEAKKALNDLFKYL